MRLRGIRGSFIPRLFAAINAGLAGRPPDFAVHHFQAFVSFISVQVVCLPVSGLALVCYPACHWDFHLYLFQINFNP